MWHYFHLRFLVHSFTCQPFWFNVLFTGNWRWRHREPFYWPYHEPVLVIEWPRHTCSCLLDTKPLWHWGKWRSGPTSKRDPRSRYRPTDLKPLVNPNIQLLVQTKWDAAVHGRGLYLVKPTLGQPKKFQQLTRAEEVVITRLRIGHTKATKAHILSRGPPAACHYCNQTLSIDSMLLECAVLQECHDKYDTADSLNALFDTIPETCIVEFLREAGFFYLIWMVRHSIQFITWITPIWWNLLT